MEVENEFEDAKTLKAVMFLMIKEHTRNIPNDQELGARIRKIINNYEKDVNRNFDINTI
jgi:methionine synthase II (cobalamin-independent)